MKISALSYNSHLTRSTLLRTYSTTLARHFFSEALQSSLKHELSSRKPNLIFDYIVPTPSHLLNVTLADFLPSSCYPGEFSKHDLELPSIGLLPHGHHLVYFSPQVPGSQLLPDGTDPLQSPGEPFVRRMWAGGSLQFNNNDPSCQLSFSGKRIYCKELISDVVVKGDELEEKIFVTIQREIGSKPHSITPPLELPADVESIRSVETKPWALLETRNLVFMRQKTAIAAKKDKAATGKIIKRMLLQCSHGSYSTALSDDSIATHDPDFSFSLLPTPSLLFRFSALTFNAHAIHLDPHYCREVEGHRNLLVHGPLSLVLMLSGLRSQLKEFEILERFDYRNLAPLYADEEMKVCVRKSRLNADKYDVWIEGRDGGYAVKGTAVIQSK